MTSESGTAEGSRGRELTVAGVVGCFESVVGMGGAEVGLGGVMGFGDESRGWSF